MPTTTETPDQGAIALANVAVRYRNREVTAHELDEAIDAYQASPLPDADAELARLREENAKLKTLATQLREALDKAESHLGYVGYGDEWERDGVWDEGGVANVIAKAQGAHDAYLEECK